MLLLYAQTDADRIAETVLYSSVQSQQSTAYVVCGAVPSTILALLRLQLFTKILLLVGMSAFFPKRRWPPLTASLLELRMTHASYGRSKLYGSETWAKWCRCCSVAAFETSEGRSPGAVSAARMLGPAITLGA